MSITADSRVAVPRARGNTARAETRLGRWARSGHIRDPVVLPEDGSIGTRSLDGWESRSEGTRENQREL